MTTNPTTRESFGDMDPSWLTNRIKMPFPAAGAELVQNGYDWVKQGITPELRIEFFREADGTKNVRFIDNGGGMGERAQRAIHSAGVSLSRGDDSKKGNFGIGHLTPLGHCPSYTYETKEPRGRLWTTTLSVTGFLKSWSRQTPLIWDSKRLPADHAISTSGTVVTLHDLQTNRRSPKAIIDKVADYLLPSTTACLVIVDYDGTEHRPKPRVLEGDPIKGAFTNLPVLGNVEIELCVVPRRKHGCAQDLTYMRAMGTGCDIRHFLAPFLEMERYESMMRPIWIMLTHTQVIGVVDIQKLVDVATPDRDGYIDEFYHDPQYEALRFAVLTFLLREVVPRLERELKMKASQIRTTDNDTFIAGLAKAIQDATGITPTGRKTGTLVLTLRLNKKRIYLERETAFQFTGKNSKPGSNYTWSLTKDAPGEIDSTSGLTCEFLASKLGECTITMMEHGEVGKVPSASCHITVVEHLPVCFRRTPITLDTNDRARLELDQIHNTSGDLHWDDKMCFGMLRLPTDGDCSYAHIESGEVEGDFIVVVTDRHDPDIRTVCNVTVKKGYKDRVNVHSAREREIEYDGQIFNLVPTHHTGTEGAMLASWLDDVVPGMRAIAIGLNMGNAIFNGPDVVREAAALLQIANRIAQFFVEREGVADDVTFFHEVTSRGLLIFEGFTRKNK